MMGMGGLPAEVAGQTAGHGVGAGAEYQGILGMSSCDKPIKVSKGDTYTIEATIDFEKHPA
jgi:hypothetical protein